MESNLHPGKWCDTEFRFMNDAKKVLQHNFHKLLFNKKIITQLRPLHSVFFFF